MLMYCTYCTRTHTHTHLRHCVTTAHLAALASGPDVCTTSQPLPARAPAIPETHRCPHQLQPRQRRDGAARALPHLLSHQTGCLQLRSGQPLSRMGSSSAGPRTVRSPNACTLSPTHVPFGTQQLPEGCFHAACLPATSPHATAACCQHGHSESQGKLGRKQQPRSNRQPATHAAVQ